MVFEELEIRRFLAPCFMFWCIGTLGDVSTGYEK